MWRGWCNCYFRKISLVVTEVPGPHWCSSLPPSDPSLRAKLIQSCQTICDPMDCIPPGSSIHRDSPSKWVVISHSRGSSWPKDQTCVCYVSCIGRRFFTTSTTWEAQPLLYPFSSIFGVIFYLAIFYHINITYLFLCLSFISLTRFLKTGSTASFISK